MKNYASISMLNNTLTKNFESQAFINLTLFISSVQLGDLLLQLFFDDVFTLGFWIPFELFLGPLLCAIVYHGFKNDEDESHKYRFIVLSTLAVFVVYLLVLSDQFFRVGITSGIFSAKWRVFVPICFALYALFALFGVIRNLRCFSAKDELVLVLGILFLLMSFVEIMVFYSHLFLSINLVVDYRLFLIILLLAANSSILVYNRRLAKENSKEECTAAKYEKSTLSDDQVQEYLKLIDDFLVTNQGFKRKDLSVKLLSKELDIPVHTFAQLFNVHLEKGFYQYVADLRIGYAIEKLQNNSFKFTVESLAEDCGFNAKTSFNKYFKQQTGVTPKEFRDLTVLKAKKT